MVNVTLENFINRYSLVKTIFPIIFLLFNFSFSSKNTFLKKVESFIISSTLNVDFNIMRVCSQRYVFCLVSYKGKGFDNNTVIY